MQWCPHHKFIAYLGHQSLVRTVSGSNEFLFLDCCKLNVLTNFWPLMGLSVSVLGSVWQEISVQSSIFLSCIRASTSNVLKSLSSNEARGGGGENNLSTVTFGEEEFKDSVGEVEQFSQVGNACKYEENLGSTKMKSKICEGIQIPKSSSVMLAQPVGVMSPRPEEELDAAATKVQKFYRSYRTRRNLADCAVVIQELWWKALDSASLKQSSVTYFDIEKQETAGSRWSRAKTRAAKVGKGLSKDEKARKLALQHWLEAIDPRHRYGHNLHFYYDDWCDSKSPQPFFYWLDVGDGKELNIESCPRTNLQHQCISYLGPLERKLYEVIAEEGKLVYKQDGVPVNTDDESKWIFVLSTSRQLYVGRKRKGVFQHSSFLSGGATKAAGRLVAHDGILEAIWPYSGHYLPTQDNFKEFLIYLEEHGVDLTSVKVHSTHENNASFSLPKRLDSVASVRSDSDTAENVTEGTTTSVIIVESTAGKSAARAVPWKWTGGTGARINYVKDQPAEFQLRAFEKVNIFPEFSPSSPAPSPRTSCT
uniref:Uncharacterized protein n=2 Tax=Kalanchoe fedtschenkoi TaxID=63787 RepID=A0A7N0U8K3_KALFE